MPKALSIRQPYAWLIVAGHKLIENRTWNTLYRGPLLIHASKKTHDDSRDGLSRRYGIAIPDDLPVGGIIGEVDLVDVVTSHRSKWFTGPFGFVLANPRACQLRPYRGRQGMFNV